MFDKHFDVNRFNQSLKQLKSLQTIDFSQLKLRPETGSLFDKTLKFNTIQDLSPEEIELKALYSDPYSETRSLHFRSRLKLIKRY